MICNFICLASVAHYFSPSYRKQNIVSHTRYVVVLRSRKEYRHKRWQFFGDHTLNCACVPSTLLKVSPAVMLILLVVGNLKNYEVVGWSVVACCSYIVSCKFIAWFRSYWGEVSTALGYGLDDKGSRVQFPAGAGNFSLHHRVQNGSGAHPATYSMGTGGSLPGGKAAGAWSWPLTSI
jgi:hypothetical protein